jgi:hypothetical protein
MRLIDADRYMKELLSAYDDVSVEFEVLDRQPLVSAIPIPEGATNGDMIKAMFPNAKVRTIYYTYFVEVKLEYHSQYDPGLLFDKKWWNAPYKGGCNLSEKPTGSESEDK